MTEANFKAAWGKSYLPVKRGKTVQPLLRTTEWYAYKLCTSGYIPGSAYIGLNYAVPQGVKNRAGYTQDDLDWISRTGEPSHRDAVGRMCPECGDRHPRIARYWHANKDGKDGLHSICRKCRNEQRRTDYRNSKAA